MLTPVPTVSLYLEVRFLRCNQVEMGLYWIRLDLNSLRGVLERTHKRNAMRRRRRRLERGISQPRDNKDGRKLRSGRKESSPEPSEGAWSC